MAAEATFLSTLPARGATSCGPFIRAETTFLSTLPARGATGGQLPRRVRRAISIHAPREGSDLHAGGHIDAEDRISIHAPREGSDAVTSCLPMLSQLFLSTLPARGATLL